MIGKSRKFRLSGFLALCCAFIGSQVSADDRVLNTVCEKGSATRSVSVVSDADFACRVRYTKSSKTSFPWEARNDADYCYSKAISLVEKLGSLGWECDSVEDIRSILVDQLERYDRHIKILNNVGKSCAFYPDEAQFGDLCGDQREEATIVYTCDADDDHWNQHLAVFIEVESEPLVSEVGGSDYRLVNTYHIENRRVVMETETIGAALGSGAEQNLTQQTTIQCMDTAGYGWQLKEE